MVAELAGGDWASDWQVGEMDPLVGLYSAATRTGLDGSHGWTAAERVGLDRSLEAYTVHGAQAWHAERDRGRIRPGMLADIAVWSSDLYALEHDPAGLLDAHAELTVVGGRVVHSAGGVADPVGAPVGDDPVSVVGAAEPHVH